MNATKCARKTTTLFALLTALVFTMLFATAAGAMAAADMPFTSLPISGSELRASYGSWDTVKYSTVAPPSGTVSEEWGTAVYSLSSYSLPNGTYYLAKQSGSSRRGYTYSNVKTFEVAVPIHTIMTDIAIVANYSTQGVKEIKVGNVSLNAGVAGVGVATTSAALDSTVTVVVTPMTNKELVAVTVTDQDGNSVTVTQTADGCTFDTDASTAKTYTVSATTQDVMNKIYLNPENALTDATITFGGSENEISRNPLNPTRFALESTTELVVTAPEGKYIKSFKITEGGNTLVDTTGKSCSFTLETNNTAGKTYVVSVETANVYPASIELQAANGIVGEPVATLAGRMFVQVTDNVGDKVEGATPTNSINNTIAGEQTVTFRYGENLTATAKLTLRHPHTIRFESIDVATVTVKDANGNGITVPADNIPADATYTVEAAAKLPGKKVSAITVTNANIKNGSFTTAAGTNQVIYTIIVEVSDKDTKNTEIRIDTDFLDTLKGMTPEDVAKEYTVEEIKQELLVGVYDEDGNVVPDAQVDVEGSLDLTKEGAQELTYTYDGIDTGSVIYNGASDVTVKIVFKDYASSVQLTDLTGKVDAVTFSYDEDGNKKVIDLTDKDVHTLDDNVWGTLKVVPASNYYISSVKLSSGTLNGGKIMDHTTTTGERVFNTGREDNEIEVVTKEALLVLSSTSISHNATMSAEEARNKIKNLIDPVASVPGVLDSAAGKLTIKYDPGLADLSDYLKDYAYVDLGFNLDALLNSSSLEWVFKLLPNLKDQINAAYHKFGDKPVEKVQITFVPNNKLIPTVSATVELTVNDPRTPTKVVLKNGETTYSASLTKEDIFDLIFTGVYTNDDNNQKISAGYDACTVSIPSLNAGTHTATVRYNGSGDYLASAAASVEYTIRKADAKMTVISQMVDYDNRSSLKEPVTISPKDASFFSFCAGLDMTSGSYIHLNMPELVDQDALDALLAPLPEAIRKTVKDTINSTMNGLSGDIPLSKLASTLSAAVKTLEGLENIGIDLPMGFDPASITQLTNVLDKVAEVMPEGMNITVKLSFAQSIIPSNAGVYIVGGVASDPNYNTTLNQSNFGYLIIKPRTSEEKLAFNVPDENGLYTLVTIADRDLGSKVVTDESQNNRLHNLFIGLDADGNFVLELTGADAAKKDTAAVRKAGTYTQIAFLLDAGNDVHYATPIVRQITVVPDLVVVKFIDENGNENNERIFTYDGNPKSMKAKAYNKSSGAEIKDAADYLTYIYAGIEGDAEGYYGKNQPPRKAGVYTVTAIYNKDSKTYGAAVGSMIIKPSDNAEITVTSRNELQGTTVYINDMVTSSPADAAKTVITAAVNVEGDFSEQGIDALMGVINVDFPKRVDDLLEKAGVNRNNVLSASGIRSEILKLLNKANSTLDSKLLTETAKLIESLPANANLTFKDNVSYKDIGVYMVMGAITDPDYTLKTDVGLLVISPKVTTATLKWDYNDVNGIITRPVLQQPGILEATAYAPDGTVSPLDPRTKYIFFGLNADGRLVSYTDAKQLPDNGVYFQIAYIVDEEISADISAVMPIWRMFALVPQNVQVTVKNQTVPYTGSPYNMETSGDITVTKAGNENVDPSSPYLTTVYVGLDTLKGLYNSTTPPTNVGSYAVVSTYVEYESRAMARGALLDSFADFDLSRLKYVGSGVGTLTIVPQGTGFDVLETEKLYDGTGKMIDFKNPDNLDYIFLIRSTKDMNNINVLLPASWGITKTYSIDVSSINTQLQSILGAHSTDPIAAKLLDILQNNVTVETLTINGALPSELGDYLFAGIAYGANSGVTLDEDTLHIVSELNGDDDDNGGIGGGGIDEDLEDQINGLPQTGDDSALYLWSALLLLCGCGMIVLRRRSTR